jgi:hypothetical protein
MTTRRKLLVSAGAFLTLVCAPVTVAVGQIGTIPSTQAGINENYETLVKAVDDAEKALKEAVADGNAANVAARRRNLDFYRRRLAALEKAATGRAKMPKDSQIVRNIQNLQERITGILDDPRNRLAQQPPAQKTARAKDRPEAAKGKARAKGPPGSPTFSPPSREQGE